jgi:hypothetical protein
MPAANDRWLDRTVWGIAFTISLTELGYGILRRVFPAFTRGLGLPPIALGASR